MIFIIVTLLKILSIVVPLLIAVAYFTIAERKIMGAIQRRRGPNVIGYIGLLQPLADGLKLFAKETTLPTSANTNIFLLAPGLTFILSLMGWAVIPFAEGVVICDFTLDWIRKWQQHKRDIKINRINLWEPIFMNFMMETYLKGTPKTAQDNYHNFSTYSYSDENNENIKFYKNYAVRAYIEPKIKYRLKKYYRTLYENNSTDIVGFLAELELAGNENTELIVLQPEEYNQSENRNTQTTWNEINKDELMDWINKQTER